MRPAGENRHGGGALGERRRKEAVMSGDSLTELFRDVPFEDLVRALRTGEGLPRWSLVFEHVVARVGAAIRRRFPHAPFADDAVQSACRTFFRRARAGGFELEGPGALVALLVGIAYRKALAQSRQAGRHGQPLPDGLDVPAAPPASAAVEERLRQAMDQQLTRMLARVEESLAEGFGIASGRSPSRRSPSRRSPGPSAAPCPPSSAFSSSCATGGGRSSRRADRPWPSWLATSTRRTSKIP
jgi:DNA-directed RNA polymerase specialized sigma24 family protein